MTPLDFLRASNSDPRTLLSEYSVSPLQIEDGDCVGVVLFSLGGPASLEDVEPFLYNLLMDPAFLDLPVGGRLRHWLAKMGAYTRAETLQERYEMVGGGSPLTRLVEEQAEALQRHLDDRYGEFMGINFQTYPAMRYWHPFGEEAAAQMADDGVDKVVLLPLYPQYSTPTTGSALAYWQALADAGERPTWPTTAVVEYAANPKYVQAVSERIDEALQRFPQSVRDEVVLVFNAHDTVFPTRHQREDSYCCLVHSTVEQVMRFRDRDRLFHTAFQSVIGPNRWLSPSIPDALMTLADRGQRAVLVVPITFVTDHINTSYGLDVELRSEVKAQGIDHFEVTAGLNTHPLFIGALGEATVAQLDPPVDVNQSRVGGNGRSPTYPLHPLHQLPSYDLNRDAPECPDCGRTAGARKWTCTTEATEPDVPSDQMASPPDDPSNSSAGSRSGEES